ncbi:hypothetical protein FS749_012978 [Ceratobasidium sp. UAMH 11750]|nr:hypothetical protein FS749_012978 [Ceratobasidium sp. UAMH 11750]
MAQAQAGSQMHEPPGVHNHPHASYLSHSQPMSTLSSERIDSPASLQTPLDSIRASSPRYSTSSSPASFGAAGPSSSSPRFDTAPFDRYEPGTRPSVPHYDAQFDSQAYQFGPAHTAPGSRSGSGSGSGSPHNFATPAPVPARTTPPGSALAQGGRRGSGSSGGDGQ